MKQIPDKIILGLWPIAGITTVGVTDNDAKGTLAAALDLGIRTFDTAFSYGYDGQSDRYLGDAIAQRRDECYVIGKVGQRYTANRTRVIDGNPDTLQADAIASLKRIGIEAFDLLMLHSVDPHVDIEASAQAFAQLQARGLCRQVGVCNVDAKQLQRFASVVQCQGMQTPLNLVQRQSLRSVITSARERGIQVQVYWTLMKGLLAGKITRQHQFAPGDGRPNYEIFQGEFRQRVHDVLDGLSVLASEFSLSIPQLTVGWAISQSGVSSALVGAHRPDQISDLVKISSLSDEVLVAIERVVSSVWPNEDSQSSPS